MNKHTPIESRLARAGRHADLRLLQDYAAPHAPSAWMPANDNEVGSTQVDRVAEIRPSPREQIRIAVNAAIKARGCYGPISPAELDAAARRNIKVEGGRITQWRGSDGKWRDATELHRQAKGARRKTDEEREADNQRHLSIRASGGFPAAPAYCERGSQGEDYRRIRAASWAQTLCACNDSRRVEIDRAGLGGRHAFAAARSNAGLAPAERCPGGLPRAPSSWAIVSTAASPRRPGASLALLAAPRMP